MAIEEALHTKLIEDSALGNLIGTRVYTLRLPQKPTYPCVVLSRVSTSEGLAHDGPIGYEIMRLQIDSYATTFASARAVADAVRAALNGASVTIGDVVIHAINFENQIDNWGDWLEIWRITQDYMVQWRRT